MNDEVMRWAIKHGVGLTAIEELRTIFGFEQVFPFADPGLSEAAVQSRVRLEAARKRVTLWRNNVGVLMDETGRPVRYGLANDSKQLNETVKSGDLIGWRPVTIAGVTIAQFVSRECKPAGWCYTGAGREPAQLRWIEAITADGGDAKFVTGEGTL